MHLNPEFYLLSKKSEGNKGKIIGKKTISFVTVKFVEVEWITA